jgi:pimeloyl-ACP methyl ester carboxylesterase
MGQTTANGITIEYETIGDPAAQPLLLVMGLGAQLITWPDGFCAQLADRGFHVVRFDNRDVGLSSKVEDGPAPALGDALTGDTSSASYLLTDMADDAAGLLDALDIGAAHVVGASMGGMIAQTLAIHHRARVRSLCSIMSTTGAADVGAPAPEALSALLKPPATTREEAIANGVEASRIIGSTTFPTPDDELAARAAAAYDRCFYPAGIARQLLAILASGDRTEALQALDVPAVVIHGSEDPLVTPSGGEATAKAIPGAELVMIDGMGHDLPEAVWPTVLDTVSAVAARA